MSDVSSIVAQSSSSLEQADDPFGAVPFDAAKIKRHLAKQNSLKGGSKKDQLSDNQTGTIIASDKAVHHSNSGQLSFRALNDHELVADPITLSNGMKSNSSFSSSSSRCKPNSDLIWF